MQNLIRLFLILLIGVFASILFRNHQIEQGKQAFDRVGCASCHMAGGAPSLQHVGRKYGRVTFVQFLADPETAYKLWGRKPMNPGFPPMPRQQLSHKDIEAISYFLLAQR